MANDLKQRFERRIDDLILQIETVGKNDDNDEVVSNLSKYLCILISGYTEKVFVDLIVRHYNNRTSPQLVRFISHKLKYVTNLNLQKIEKILNAFDSEWVAVLQKKMNYDIYTDSLSTIYGNRNNIAHGGISTITVSTLKEAYHYIKELIEEIRKIINTKGL